MENYELECLLEEDRMRDANSLIRLLMFGLDCGNSVSSMMTYVSNEVERRGCEEEFRKELIRRLSK